MKNPLRITYLLFTPVLLFAQAGLEPADMLKPLSDQWTSYSGDLTGKRFSSLKLINTNTVKNLSLKWISNGITTACAWMTPGSGRTSLLKSTCILSPRLGSMA